MGGPTPSPDESSVVSIGEVLAGRYKIERVLGSGGMGRVYRAEHIAIGKPVAIKVLHAALGRDREATIRFQREAVASGRLDHPNIVGVLDFGVLDNGSLYLVMEALEGEHLGRRLTREKPMVWCDALTVARGVLLGLRHAHDRGVIHRDIKPDNIFLANKDGDEVVKILDFGIAKLYAGAQEELAATRSGITVGTPTYLSPEQAVGGAITPACDLYSTSVVLYEMLVGCPPFHDDNPITVMTSHATGEVPAFHDLDPKLVIPDGLEAIVRHGLEKMAAERIGSALEYVQRIDEILVANGLDIAGTPLPTRPSQMFAVPAGPSARPTPAPGRFVRALSPRASSQPANPPAVQPRRRAVSKKWLLVGAGVIACAVAGGVALFSGRHHETIDAPTPAPVAATAPRVAQHPPPPHPPRPAVVDDRETRLKAALQLLQQGATCAERKAAIPRLVELRDPSAIGALKKARNRGAVNACLRIAADDAVKRLRSVKKQP